MRRYLRGEVLAIGSEIDRVDSGFQVQRTLVVSEVVRAVDCDCQIAKHLVRAVKEHVSVEAALVTRTIAENGCVNGWEAIRNLERRSSSIVSLFSY